MCRLRYVVYETCGSDMKFVDLGIFPKNVMQFYTFLIIISG